MDTQLLLVIGGVIVAIVLVLYWQRQGVVKRPSATVDADTVKSEGGDWLAGTDPPSLPSAGGDGIGLTQEQLAQINAEIAAKRKINAIKLYREFTGEGLKEAKEAVEALERGQKPAFSANHPSSASQPAGDLMARIEQELRAGRKIEAIKLYREFTGQGLKEAKEAVEAIERGQKPAFSANHPSSASQPAGDLMAQIEQELRAGRKINAVKLYREAHNVGLKEAKDEVDEIERNLRM